MSDESDVWEEIDRLHEERAREALPADGPDPDDEMPLDPDLDDLPEELRERPGSFRIGGVDPETGERYEAPVTRDELGSAFADERRRRQAE
jgi:hypothetical protein